jgi:hypothetical protein
MDEKGSIQKAIQILDRYSKLYEKLSQGHFKNYGAYMSSGNFGDEDDLTKPKLWVDFLEEVLEFPKDEYIPELTGLTGTPDFQPRDQWIHPFFFELKGSDTENLTLHYPQVEQYLKLPLKWGVITNMRDLVVYEQGSKIPIFDYSFSFLQLYKDFKTHQQNILDFPNTKKVLGFINRFKFQKLSQQDKIERLKKAPQWTNLEKLDPEELLESIHKVVNSLVDDARPLKSDLIARFQYMKTVPETILVELEGITCELDRRRIQTDAENLKFTQFADAKPGSVEHQAFEVYLKRIAYFAMTRILIARMWEDIGFIEQSLYNGGFEKWYEFSNRKIEEVLEHAFHLARDQYDWLFGERNNYHWYIPSEGTLVDVLFEFAKYNLGKLDQDILGKVYEQFVERIDRKNIGQYYTPREIISLIWNRVGFTNDTAFFRYENGQRNPRLIFDIATGSGGFLVEAAQRIRTQTRYDPKDYDALQEIKHSIIGGLCGSEINPFAHYITEVNLLIQLTPVIKEIISHPKAKHLTRLKGLMEPFTLSVIPEDSLSLVEHMEESLLEPRTAHNGPRKIRAMASVLNRPKVMVRERLVDCNDFDYACSNPPYIGEKGHKELFRSTIQRYPYWRRHYQGKMDYLYWFIILGLSKLREGGKLGFITTSYWPTAGGASRLRQFILENALIKEIIDFGETKIFEGAPGQHNMVFILEKCPDTRVYDNGTTLPNKENSAKKKNNRIKIAKVQGIPIQPIAKKPLARIVGHIETHIEKKEYSDDYVNIFYCPVKQGELTEGAWNSLFMQTDVDSVFSKVNSKLLKEVLEIRQGIVPGIDRVTKQNIKSIPSEKITEDNIQTGDGIFILTKEEVQQLHLTKEEKEFFVPSYHNSHISPYIVDIPEKNIDYILYIDREIDLNKYLNIKRHLEKYKDILKSRIERYEERGYKESYPWYRLNRPRDKDILSNEKIVVSNWGTTWQPFALQSGDFFEKRDVTFFAKQKGIQEELSYFLGILNSQIIKWWMTQKARQLGYMRQSIQEQIPIRRIDFTIKDEIKTHETIAKKVETMIETKEKLAEYNKFFRSRLTRLEGPKETLEPDAYAITKSLVQSDLRVLRTHPRVQIEVKGTENFYLAKIGEVKEATELFTKPTAETPYSIQLTGKDKKHITIIAPKEIVYYLREVLKDYTGKSYDEIKEISLAKDLETYAIRKNEILKEVKKLLTKVESLQVEIDDIVYDLYGITQAERKIIEQELAAKE